MPPSPRFPLAADCRLDENRGIGDAVWVIELIDNPQIHEACRTFRVKTLHVFGSCASETENSLSDVDLLVEFERDGYTGAFDQLMTFKETMEQLLQRPVDLIVHRQFRNSCFQQEIERTKRLVYAA